MGQRDVQGAAPVSQITKLAQFPICSMYGVFTYIWVIFKANVGNIPYMEHMGSEDMNCRNLSDLNISNELFITKLVQFHPSNQFDIFKRPNDITKPTQKQGYHLVAAHNFGPVMSFCILNQSFSHWFYGEYMNLSHSSRYFQYLNWRYPTNQGLGKGFCLPCAKDIKKRHIKMIPFVHEQLYNV